MPLFSSTSPFDADVDRVTDEINTEENWSLILDICDRAKQSPTACKDCLRSIMRRLRHKVPHVAMQALTLLNACVKNCGHTFHLEIASRDFISDCRSLIADKAHPKVALQLRLYVKSWAEGEFKDDASLSLIPSLYNSLVSEGLSFTSDDVPKSKVAVSSDPNVVSSQEEEEDVAKAIALSLQDNKKQQQQQRTSSLYPTMFSVSSSMSTSNKSQEPRKVKAVYDFEAVEDNELTFKAGEVIGILDDSDVNWWKGVSWRGEGLFPANFVTDDLSTETVTETHVDVASETPAEQPVESVRIDEELIDRALVMIQNADPTGELDSDLPELAKLEEQCFSMTPLIDQELEQIDRQHSCLMEINGRLIEALQLYHNLMQELPVYTTNTMPTYMSLNQMYGSQQPMTQNQIPSGIAANVGTVPAVNNSSTFYTQNQPPQYLVHDSSYRPVGYDSMSHAGVYANVPTSSSSPSLHDSTLSSVGTQSQYNATYQQHMM